MEQGNGGECRDRWSDPSAHATLLVHEFFIRLVSDSHSNKKSSSIVSLPTLCCSNLLVSLYLWKYTRHWNNGFLLQIIKRYEQTLLHSLSGSQVSQYVILSGQINTTTMLFSEWYSNATWGAVVVVVVVVVVLAAVVSQRPKITRSLYYKRYWRQYQILKKKKKKHLTYQVETW